MSKYRKVIYPCVFLFSLGVAGLHAAIKKESEVKDASEPVHQFSDRYNKIGDNIPHHYLHKRQISPQFQSFAQTRFFRRPFDNTASVDFTADSSVPIDGSNAAFNRRPEFSSRDEEERFFLSRETTTLNPLSFFTMQTTTTTLDPLEEQRIEEQRRFQEEIANKGLREQHQNIFTTTTTTTTSPSADAFSIDQLLSDPNSFPPADLTSPSTEVLQQSLLESAYLPKSGRFSQSVQTPAQSYSFVRTYRRQRSLDLKSPENEKDNLAISPQQALVNNLLQDANPHEDLVKIGSWLVDNLAKTVERNIAKFAEGVVKQRSIVKPVPYSTPANWILSEYRSTPKPRKVLTNLEPLSNYISPEYHSSPKLIQNLVIPEVRQVYLQEPQSNSKLINNLVPTNPNLFQEYQSTSKPIQLFHSLEPPASPLPITFSQTTPKIDWNVSPKVSFDWRPENLLSQPQTPKLETVSYPIPTIRTSSIASPSTFAPQNSVSSTTVIPKIRNIQVLPTPGLAPVENHSNLVSQTVSAYNNFNQHSTPKLVETTTVYAPVHLITSTENEASTTSLFKSKLNAFKDTETQEPSALQKSFSETQQADQFFDLLTRYNVTVTPIPWITKITRLFIQLSQVSPPVQPFLLKRLKTSRLVQPGIFLIKLLA